MSEQKPVEAEKTEPALGTGSVELLPKKQGELARRGGGATGAATDWTTGLLLGDPHDAERVRAYLGARWTDEVCANTPIDWGAQDPPAEGAPIFLLNGAYVSVSALGERIEHNNENAQGSKMKTYYLELNPAGTQYPHEATVARPFKG